MTKQSEARSGQVTWQSLNKRQQDYLTAIYQADQEVEAEERSSFSRGDRSRPASQWRPMPYASSFPGRLPFPVKKHLSWTEQISEGTGSTLEALEKRGLIAMQHLSVEALRSRGIITKWQGILEPEPIPVIEITPLGRKMVRQALGIQMIRHVTGTLQEWHWRALVLAYIAREGKGVAMEYGNSGDYGRIGWKTWLRLREYSPAPLIQVYHEQSSGSPYTNYYVQITSFGIAFYERAFARYQALYPSIEAPAPLAPPDPFEPYSEMGQGHETCRACQGEYLVEITRTYQQARNFTWRVEEQASRIPGRVESPYGEVEQCLCQEEEIQEMSAPFLVLLDRLVEQDWQVSFPHHHWIDYLDYLVGGVSLGRERRWYDWELAKAKVLPLLDDTTIDDARNVVKGDMQYCWNEHVGKGSIYPQGLSGGLSMRPVAITCAKETNR